MWTPFFPSCYSFTYQGNQMLPWGSLPIPHHWRWADVKTLQSKRWEAELLWEPWFVPLEFHPHLYLVTHTRKARRTTIISGGPGLPADASCLLPPAHTSCLPPSVRYTMFLGRSNKPPHLHLFYQKCTLTKSIRPVGSRGLFYSPTWYWTV